MIAVLCYYESGIIVVNRIFHEINVFTIESITTYFSTLTLIHTGVVSIAPPNFEEILLKKYLSKVSQEKLWNPQELH
jgi:hypothetical protein